MSTASAPAVQVAATPDSPPSGLDGLVLPLLPAAYRTALWLTHNRADAEDAVQDAVLRALEGFHGFRFGTNFRAWFMQVLTNVCLGYHRRARARGVTVPFDDGQGLDLDPGTPSGNAADAYFVKLDIDLLTEKMQRLPVEYRSVAELYFFEDRSYAEIAARLACPVGTVKSRLHRARRILRHALRNSAAKSAVIAATALGDATNQFRRLVSSSGNADTGPSSRSTPWYGTAISSHRAEPPLS